MTAHARVPEAPAPDVTNDLIEQLHARGTVRSFRPDPVSDAMVDAIFAASFRCPSSCNQEAYSLIVVRDATTRRRISEMAGNENGPQKQIAQAPVFVAICADLSRIKYACESHGMTFTMEDCLEMGLVSSIDASLVGMTASLVAESLGLGACMIGAMRNDPEEAARILGLPPLVYVVYGLCIGWAAEPVWPKPRMSLDTLVHRERYDESVLKPGVAAYDAALADYYRATGKPSPPNSWTGHMIKRFSIGRRLNLRPALKALGFPLK